MKLSEYVIEIMRNKDLGLKDVERNSRGRISHGYVSDIIQEKTINPTVEKLKALALGLKVPEDEIFRVARGLRIEPEYRQPEKMTAILEDLSENELSSVMEIMSLLSGLSEGERIAISEMLSVFSRLSDDSQYLLIQFAEVLLTRSQDRKKGSPMITRTKKNRTSVTAGQQSIDVDTPLTREELDRLKTNPPFHPDAGKPLREDEEPTTVQDARRLVRSGRTPEITVDELLDDEDGDKDQLVDETVPKIFKEEDERFEEGRKR